MPSAGPLASAGPAVSVKSSARCRQGRARLAQNVNRYTPKSHSVMRPTCGSVTGTQVEPELLTAGSGRRRLVRRAPPPRSTLRNQRFTTAPSAHLSSAGKATDVFSYHPDPWKGQGCPGPRSTLMTVTLQPALSPVRVCTAATAESSSQGIRL